jgi:hypothetical protein
MARRRNARKATTSSAQSRKTPRATDGRRQAEITPQLPLPEARRLRVYAFDPLLGTKLEAVHLNEAVVKIRWEGNLAAGPVGEYFEVVDIDPPSDTAYEPVDLNHPHILAQHGIAPTEGNPQFHQQMVYAVAMKTVEHFERALGRVALWADRSARVDGRFAWRFVRRLRIYPHALREANAFYSPDRMALLFGYFSASRDEPGENLPGGLIFTCLSHDIVAHETTHALLDGLHPRYKEETNLDMLAFHEAFADIVALFQHFTIPEALRDEIAKRRGDLSIAELLAGLAGQFGQAIGYRGALRSAIATFDEATGVWQPTQPTPRDYQANSEPHARGTVLVGAVFAAFVELYGRATQDLFRLASGGTGILPPGQIPHDLVIRLSDEAAKVAAQILHICIRALDYCPPVDLTFGEYLRGLITADRDLVPDDVKGQRLAFISAFRARGIFPAEVANLSVDALTWQPPDFRIDALEEALGRMSLSWKLNSDRFKAFESSNDDARTLHQALVNGRTDPQIFRALGLVKTAARQTVTLNGVKGTVSPIQISVRPARRIGPDNQILDEVVIELTQRWTPDNGAASYRGGCTVICDRESGKVRYLIRKRLDRPFDTAATGEQLAATSPAVSPHANFFGPQHGREPFALLHRSI